MFHKNLNNNKVLKKSLKMANNLKKINGGGDPFLNNTRTPDIDFSYEPSDLYNMQQLTA